MEQSHACKCHCHAESVAGFNDIIVTNGAAGFCNIAYAALCRTFNIITEGEEGIGAKRNTLDRGKICFLFFLCQRFRLFGEQCLPCAICQNVLIIIGNIDINGIISVGAAYGRQERQVEYLFMLSQMPDISFVACQSGAVNSGLLSCAN